MKRRILALLVALCMLLVLVPAFSVAAVPPPSELWIDDGVTEVEVFGDAIYSGDGWEYDADLDVLILDGFDGVYIYAEGDLDIVLDGENYAECIEADGDLSISGSGTLDLDCSYYVALYAGGNLSLSGSAIVSAESDNSDGVYAGGDITVSDSAELYGYGGYIGIDADGSITVSDSAILSGDGRLGGVGATGDIIVSGSATLYGDGYYGGIYAGGDITASGNATLTGAGWDGIWAYGNILFSGSVKVTGTGAMETDGGYSYGIYAYGTLEIDLAVGEDFFVEGKGVIAEGEGGLYGGGIVSEGSIIQLGSNTEVVVPTGGKVVELNEDYGDTSAIGINDETSAHAKVQGKKAPPTGDSTTAGLLIMTMILSMGTAVFSGFKFWTETDPLAEIL